MPETQIQDELVKEVETPAADEIETPVEEDKDETPVEEIETTDVAEDEADPDVKEDEGDGEKEMETPQNGLAATDAKMRSGSPLRSGADPVEPILIQWGNQYNVPVPVWYAEADSEADSIPETEPVGTIAMVNEAENFHILMKTRAGTWNTL